MIKPPKNRAMVDPQSPTGRSYFFPKATPPQVIVADSIEEAEAKLVANKA